jgi:recombination protein RecT
MSNITTTTGNKSIKDYFSNDQVRSKFAEVLGTKTASFCTTVVQIASQSEMLQKCDPASIMQSAMVAATLDLPVNPNLGFAYILPYGSKAQFQLGYKGLIQLAQRSGQFINISATPIYDGQIASENPLTGYVFDFTKKSSKVVGYAAYFKLLNGFEKTLYMSVEQLQAHGKKYSQTYKKGFGLWADDFDSMAQKTVIKLLLSKYAPLSVEMSKALVADQAVIEDADTMDVTYVDNQSVSNKAVEAQISDKEKTKRLLAAINKAKAIDDLDKLDQYIDRSNAEISTAYDNKRTELSGAENLFN